MGVLTSEEYRIIVQNCLKTTEFEVIEYEARELSGSYDTFSGDKVQLVLTVKRADKEQQISLNFFAKLYPKVDGFHKDFLKSIKVFYKETQLYKQVLNNLNERNKDKILAKCYFAKSDEILVLEDLTSLGFRQKSLLDTCSIEECEIVLNAMAKLHASSIIYEENHGTTIDRLVPDILFEPLFVSDPEHPGFHHLCVGINAIESVIEAYFSHIPSKICERAYKLMRMIPEKMKPSTKKRNVLTHSNLWVNNIMFCYNFEGKVEDARLVNFKFARYCPPAFDVLLFIYLSTTHGLRETDMEAFLIYYYNKLGRELADADLNINNFMTWAEFKSSIDEETPNVLAMSTFYLNFCLLPSDKIQNILKSSEMYEAFIKEDRSQIVLDAMRTNEIYRKRISQSITDIVEYVKHH